MGCSREMSQHRKLREILTGFFALSCHENVRFSGCHPAPDYFYKYDVSNFFNVKMRKVNLTLRRTDSVSNTFASAPSVRGFDPGSVAEFYECTIKRSERGSI